ncbi:hypothetical protein K7B55_003482 [Salmonella enterica]|nr:hypothetical protein [Salmonella enterica]EIA2529628.1 hypothetical protein [Salmonella enterica]EIA2552765.1 hypothetical protein [Salmonella enterica]EID4480316.1 hypothetical protein [Salmonella enterica]
MTTTTKCLLAGIALTMCGSALAAVTPYAESNSPTIKIGETAHNVTVVVGKKVEPLVFNDLQINPNATAGNTLSANDIITGASFSTSSNHKYVLSSESGDAVKDGVSFSFSDQSSILKGKDYKWLTADVGAGTAYVLVSKDANGELGAGLHNYTFVVTDYSA